jgi:hypothetical protein
MAEQGDRNWPSAADLNVAEQFVLWALRTRLEGAGKLDRLEEGFRLAGDGTAGGAARAAFEPWFAALASPLLPRSLPPSHALSVSERRRARHGGLVASAQAGDEARLQRVAATLVHPRGIGHLLGASRRFAGALRLLDLHLSGAQPGAGAAALRH